MSEGGKSFNPELNNFESKKDNNFEQDIKVNDPIAVEYFENQIEETTDKYRKSEIFQSTMQKIEDIAIKAGFKNGIKINENGEKIEIPLWSVYGGDIRNEYSTKKHEVNVIKEKKDFVFIGEMLLVNIKKLIDIDEEFAKIGLLSSFEHENQHLKVFAGKIMEKIDNEMEKSIGQCKDYESLKNRNEKINMDYYPPAEKQTELQRINDSYKDYDGFIESQAIFYLFSFVIRYGFGILKEESLLNNIKKILEQYSGSSFINDNVQKDIIGEIDVKRKGLLEKYKKYRRQKYYTKA